MNVINSTGNRKMSCQPRYSWAAECRDMFRFASGEQYIHSDAYAHKRAHAKTCNKLAYKIPIYHYVSPDFHKL